MDQERTERAIARIEAAMARLETAAQAAPVAALAAARERHDRLRTAVTEALGQLDAMIDVARS